MKVEGTALGTAVRKAPRGVVRGSTERNITKGQKATESTTDNRGSILRDNWRRDGGGKVVKVRKSQERNELLLLVLSYFEIRRQSLM